MTSISYRPRPGTAESSFGGVMDESNATAADTSFAYSTPHQSYRSKASRDPLLPPMNPASGSVRSTTESSHVGLAGVFARRSIESSRMSSDLEQGVREASEQHRNLSPPPAGAIPTADLTRPSSLDNSDDRAHTYRTIGDASLGDLHHSKLSQIDRAGPKATIHPHPVIIPASPILDPKTGKPVRNYQLIPSKSIFFFRGKALTGGDTPLPFIATLTLVLGLAAAWFACTAPWWWNNISVAVPIVAGYMTLFCLASLLMTVSQHQWLGFLTLTTKNHP
jgi:palmitoyltransferase ZDHHC9/14/18